MKALKTILILTAFLVTGSTMAQAECSHQANADKNEAKYVKLSQRLAGTKEQQKRARINRLKTKAQKAIKGH
ncbi:MAG: hypothetical protein KDD58_01455 [Bdellovibrionales bacterium]|nr:hypothetical protein [Bdellovibrionales bacterium]